MDNVLNKIIIGVSIAAIPGIFAYLYSFLTNYVTRRRRLVYGLYNELLSNHEMLNSCINFSNSIAGENIPRLNTQYYEGEFSKSAWTRFFNGIKPLRIPENIKSEDLLKRFEHLKNRPFVSSVHLLYTRIRLLNYVSIDSLQEGRTFNKGFMYKTRVNSVRYDLFILIHNMEEAFDYLGERSLIGIEPADG